MSSIRVLIVDDHPLIRLAIRAAIEGEAGMEVCGEADDGPQAVALSRRLNPDVILMDLFLPNSDGLEATQAILQQAPQTRVLVLTGVLDDSLVLQAIRLGVRGYMTKALDRAELIAAIRIVHQGEVYLPPSVAATLAQGLRQETAQPPSPPGGLLTGREQEVLAWVGKGASNREIAAQLMVSEGTVRAHIHHLLAKLGLKSRSQAILYARKQESS